MEPSTQLAMEKGAEKGARVFVQPCAFHRLHSMLASLMMFWSFLFVVMYMCCVLSLVLDAYGCLLFISVSVYGVR